MPRPARRRQLLGAAQEVFVSNGYHAAAMDEIAERAGVSKPVLYQHFPGKLDLYLALLDEHGARLEKRVRDALASTTDNHERIRASIAAYFDFVDGEGGGFRLLFETDLRNEPAVRERVERTTRIAVEAIADTIARDTGLPREEAELLSCGLAGLAEMSARWWLAAAEAVPKEHAVELMTALCWRGIGGFPRAADE
jgi:AcrR family transcriptional regulator